MILGIGQIVKSVLYQNGTIGPRRSSPALRSISTLLLGSVRFVMFFYANVKVFLFVFQELSCSYQGSIFLSFVVHLFLIIIKV